MSYSYHRSSSPSLRYLSDDDTNDYYDYYADVPVPSGNYTYGYVSDYSPPRSDHYVRVPSEGSGEAMHSIEEEVQPDSGRASTSWQGFASIDSPVLVVPEPAPDYARMSMLSETPPPSNVSVHTYLQRFAKFCKKVREMPWMSAERTTADYYPEKNIQRRRRAKNLLEEDWYERDAKEITAVSWKSRRYVEKRQGMHGGLDFEMVVGGGGDGDEVLSPYLGSERSRASFGSGTGVIEPFPFTSAPPREDGRRFRV